MRPAGVAAGFISPDREVPAMFARRPRAEDAPLRLAYRDIVDAGLAAAHQSVLVELPQFVSVAAPPLPGHVMRLVLEPHGDPVGGAGPQVLPQRVVQLTLPLGGEEPHDLLAAGDEGTAVAPD